MSQIALDLIAQEATQKTGYLDLGNCGLTQDNPLLEQVWHELGNLSHLETLILSNEWMEWNEEKQKWNQNKSQNHSQPNNLAKLHINISQLLNLSRFICCGSRYNYWSIADIEFLSPLSNLKYLILSNNQISSLNPIGELNTLIYLDIGYNQVTDLSALEKLNNLNVLSLSRNKIFDLYPLSSLSKILILRLDNNEIADITPVRNLINLKRVTMWGNKITKIDAFKHLLKLRTASLDFNEISDISPLLPILKRTKSPCRLTLNSGFINEGDINIGNNPINFPPLEIVEQGNEAVINWFKQKEEQGTVPIYEAKMILVGEAGTGKTTLRKKLLDPNYPVPNDFDAKHSTHAIEITKQVPFLFGTQPIMVNIWDFGGQHNYYSTHRYFLTEWALYVLVVDERKENTRFEYWFQIIDLLTKDTSGQKTPILVLYNKRSGQSMQKIDLHFFSEKFPNLVIDSIEVDFSETNWGSERLRIIIGKKLAGLQHIGLQVPTLWQLIREELEEIRIEEHANYIDRKRYFDICRKHGLSNTEDQLYLSKFLHRIGVILHYQDDTDLLARSVILNPDWAIDAIYAALSDREKLHAGCFQFEKSWLETYWRQKGYELEEYEIFLTLMFKNRFEIAYSRKDRNGTEWVIVPELLPPLPPAHNLQKGINPLVFRYEYEFMPEGLLSHFIVRMSEEIMEENHEQLVWKNGVLLHHKNSVFSEIRRLDIEGNRKIKFETNLWGGSREGFLWRIRKEFELVNRRFSDNLKPIELIPCICSECKKSKNTQFYDLSKLLSFKEKGKTTKECPESGENVSLPDLLKHYDPETGRKIWEEEKGGLIDTIAHLNQEKIKLETVLDSKGYLLQNIIAEDIKNAIKSFEFRQYLTSARSIWTNVEHVADQLLTKNLTIQNLTFSGLSAKINKLEEIGLLDALTRNIVNPKVRNYLAHGNVPIDENICKVLVQEGMLVLSVLIQLLN